MVGDGVGDGLRFPGARIERECPVSLKKNRTTQGKTRTPSRITRGCAASHTVGGQAGVAGDREGATLHDEDRPSGAQAAAAGGIAERAAAERAVAAAVTGQPSQATAAAAEAPIGKGTAAPAEAARGRRDRGT